MLKVVLSGACLAALSACGGGGGGGGGGSSTGPVGPVVDPKQAWLTITPSQVELSTYQGEPLAFTISAKSSKIIEKVVNAAIVDSAGVIASNAEIKPVSAQEYSAYIQIAPGLAVGEQSTTLELRLCEDDPKVCKTPLEGSPWKIPLKVSVKSGTNLSALRSLPQVPNWGTYQGNAAHTGYVAARFDPQNFSRRWFLADKYLNKDNQPVVHDNGAVFMSFVEPGSGNAILAAVSEDSGKEVWRSNLGSLYKLNPPAAAQGKVFALSSGHADSAYWVFKQDTGAQLAKRRADSQWDQYRSPTVFGDAVYSNTGAYGGLAKYAANSDELLWFGNAPQYDGWTPAVDGNYAYLYADGALHALRTGDGGKAFAINDASNIWSGYTGATPVLTDKNSALVISSGNLVSFDLVKRTVAWTVKSAMLGQPAYAKDVAYGLSANGSALEAHALATGALLWKAADLPGRFSNLIVSDNLAFVSSDKQTLAIDLATQKIVWQHPVGGALSISNRGVLYIATNRSLFAVNLQ